MDEAPPFKWKLVAHSDGYNVVLRKTIDKKDAEDALTNLKEQGLYHDLRIYAIEAKIPQPKWEEIRDQEKKLADRQAKLQAKETQRRQKEQEREKKRKKLEKQAVNALRKKQNAKPPQPPPNKNGAKAPQPKTKTLATVQRRSKPSKPKSPKNKKK